MKFAVVLLGILAAACCAGSFLTQGQSFDWYAQQFSERAAAAIWFLRLDDVFHSIWFCVLTAFLCLNLLLCSVLRFPALLRRWKEMSDARKNVKKQRAPLGYLAGPEPEPVFEQLGFHKVQSGDADQWRYAAKNRIGLWGAWLCHLGILILILGFALGQIYKTEYTIYGVPGQSAQVEDTDYIVTIDDFSIGLREDDTVEQYTSQLTVRNAATGASRSVEASVNHPASAFGMKLYQNSTGWAATVSVEKDGEILQEEVLCAGEYLEVEDKEGLYLMLNAVYPDYARDEEGNMVSKSSLPVNPGYLYSIYYGDQVVGMNVLTGGDVINVDDYTFRIDRPQNYTLIQIRTDPFTGIALAGALLIALALVLAFYLQPARLWAVRTGDGAWAFYGESKKGGALFEERVREALAESGSAPSYEE